MTTFEVIEMKRRHCGQIIKHLRIGHQIALEQVKRDAHREIVAIFEESAFRRAWLIDGRLAAVGGVTGSIIASTGYAWLALTEEATLHRVALLKEVMRQLAQIMVSKRELATTVLGGDPAARRLAIFLGFHVDDEGPGSPAYTRLGRRALGRHIDAEPDLRIPVGEGYVIGMGYHAPDEMRA